MATYTGRYGADGGGGFNECGALNPHTPGEYAAGGDTWGWRYSTSWGNEWIGSMAGLAAVKNPDHCRAAFFSARVATNGLRFYGAGSNQSTGHLYYSLPGQYSVTAVDSNGFGLGLSSGWPNGTVRRPCGHMFDSWVKSGDLEYIFTYTTNGLLMYPNTSTASGLAAKANALSATTLAANTFGGGLPGFVTVLNSTHLIVGNWDHNTSQTAIPTAVYVVKTSASDWSGATSGNTTAISQTLPMSADRVYEVQQGRDGLFYAACGYDGAWMVSISGDTLTWTHISAPGGNEACDFAASIDADSNGIVWVAQSGDTQGGYDNSSGGGMPLGHSVVKGNAAHTTWTYPASGSAVHTTEFKAGDTTTGTGRVWWLASQTAALSQPSHEANVIRVDPFDDNKVALFGRAGCWQTRNGGTGWYPAMNGMNGGQTISGKNPSPLPGSPGIKTTGPTSLSNYNDDYLESHTTDGYKTAVKGTNYTVGTGGFVTPLSGAKTFTGDDGASYTFTSATSSNPATLTRNGVAIHDAKFQGAIISAVSIAADQNGSVYILQNGGGIFVMEASGTVTPPAPTISSFTPTTAASGDTVTVSGSHFTGAASVHIGATNVPTYSVLDDATLTLTVPGGASTGTITITTAAGTGVSSGSLTIGSSVAAPTISGISPTSGVPGDSITVTGTNLASASSVKIGGSGGTPVIIATNTSTTITFAIPNGAASGRVWVQTAGGSVTSSQTLTITTPPPPTVFQITSLPQGVFSRTATMQVKSGLWTTNQQAQQVAQECVLVSVNWGAPLLNVLMAANPRIGIAAYCKSIQNPANTGAYDAAGTKYPAKWYTKLKNGTKAKQGGQFVNWVMESGQWTETRVSATVTGPLSGTSITATHWAGHHLEDCFTKARQQNALTVQAGSKPYRAIFLDSMGTFSADSVAGFWTGTNPGWNPHTNAAYTKPDFLSMAYFVGDTARGTLNADNQWIIGNGLRPNASIPGHVDMAMAEGWLVTGATLPAMTPTAYEASLQLVLTCQASGTVAQLFDWGLAGDTAALESQRRRFMACSYFIAHRGLATFEYSQAKTTAPWLETARDPTLYALDAGSPLANNSPTTAHGHQVATGSGNGQASAVGLYRRMFTAATFLANPTGTAITYKADQAYDLLPTPGQGAVSYTLGQSISIPAVHGVILVPTAPVGTPPTNTALPAVTGPPVEGQILGRNVGSWSGDTPITYSDQWQYSTPGTAGTATVPTWDAVKAAYSGGTWNTLKADYVGKTWSDLVNTFSAAPSGAPTTWTAIPGATQPTYQIPAVTYRTDSIRDRVVATNAAGSGTAYTQPVGPVTAASGGGGGTAPAWTTLPSIQGTPIPGNTLNRSVGVITGSPTPTTVTTWQTSASNLPASWVNRATAATWTIPATGYAGQYVRISVKASNTAGTATQTSSSLQIGTSNVKPSFTANPVISGTATVGQTLTAAPGTASGIPVPTLTRVWQTSADSGATWQDTTSTGLSYLEAAGIIGDRVRVHETAINTAGTATANSNTIGPVQAGTVTVGGLTLAVIVE